MYFNEIFYNIYKGIELWEKFCHHIKPHLKFLAPIASGSIILVNSSRLIEFPPSMSCANIIAFMSASVTSLPNLENASFKFWAVISPVLSISKLLKIAWSLSSVRNSAALMVAAINSL